MLGHPERGIELADKAIRLSPRDPWLPGLYWQKAYLYFILQQDVQAIEWLRLMVTTTEWPLPRLYLAAALALNGSEAEARETIKQYLSLPKIEIRTIRALMAWLWWWSPNTEYWATYVKRLSEGLRRAGMPEG